jgi:hypothetical protein
MLMMMTTMTRLRGRKIGECEEENRQKWKGDEGQGK